MPSISLMTLNARGLESDNEDEESGTLWKMLNALIKWHKSHGLAVLCVQEHNLRPERTDAYVRMAKGMGITLRIGHGRAGSQAAQESRRGGVLTASMDSAITHKAMVHVEPGLMLQRFDWCGKRMEVANVYAPTAGGARIDFFSRVLRKHLKVDTIVGGDFNCVSDPTLDVVSADPLSYSNGGARVLSEVMEGVQLVDERREQLGSEIETTRGSNTSNGYTSTRVDKWYLPQANKWLWTINTVNTFMFKQTASDHNGVMLKIEDRDGEIGHERVTINANIMRDPAVQDAIAEIANEVYKTHARKSESRKWRITEAAVYDYMVKETKRRKKKDKRQILYTKKILECMRRRHANTRMTDVSKAAEKAVQRRLFELENPELNEPCTEGQATFFYEKSGISSRAYFSTYKDKAARSHVNAVWINDWKEDTPPRFEAEGQEWKELEEGEARGRRIQNEALESALGGGDTRFTRRQWEGMGVDHLHMDQYVEAGGKSYRPARAKTTTGTGSVGGEFVKLFKVIYSEKMINEPAARELLRRMGRRKLLEATWKALEEDIKEAEIMKVMESLPEGKQAGPNRIPNEVYKALSTVFAPKMTALLKEAHAKGKLPSHFLEGDIAMLYKKNEREDTRNYRPITLLNTDYKIFTRVLTARMREVVHEFTSECQKGFVPGTFIAEATMMMQMVEAYINEEDSGRKGAFLFLDMEKAFDRVSYAFTKRGLKALGFGPNFRKWVGMMYNEDRPPRRRMYVNGYYSEWFDIKSGVAQGCPLSPLLFLVVAEALNVSFAMEPGLKGIQIGKNYYKLSQFADDTSLLLRRLCEIEYANRALKRWCAATGMRENVPKGRDLHWGCTGDSWPLGCKDRNRTWRLDQRESSGHQKVDGAFRWECP